MVDKPAVHPNPSSLRSFTKLTVVGLGSLIQADVHAVRHAVTETSSSDLAHTLQATFLLFLDAVINLRAVYFHLPGCGDAKTDLAILHCAYGDLDVITDHDGLMNVASKNEHVNPSVGLVARYPVVACTAPQKAITFSPHISHPHFGWHLLGVKVISITTEVLNEVPVQISTNKSAFFLGGVLVIALAVSVAYKVNAQVPPPLLAVAPQIEDADTVKTSIAQGFATAPGQFDLKIASARLAKARLDGFPVCTQAAEATSQQYVAVAGMLDAAQRNAPLFLKAVDGVMDSKQGMSDCDYRVISIIGKVSSNG